MESEEPNDLTKNLNFYKMALLYAQTKELHKAFNHKMELSPLKYYLVSKKWVDDYKLKYNYNNVVEKLKNSSKFNEYYSAKVELNMTKIDKNRFTTMDVEKIIDNFFSCELIHVKEYEIDIPKNIELVYEKFFEDCLNNSNMMGFKNTEVYVGNQDILINDEENKALYCCSLVKSDDNNFNFEVKVEYLLLFASIDDKNDQVGAMVDLDGLNNYLKKVNIDINKKGQQNLVVRGKRIGFFLKMEEKSDDIFNNEPNIDLNTNIVQSFY